MIVYKVVYVDRSRDGRFFSVCASDSLEVEYKINSPAYPPKKARELGYPLTSFQRISDVERYLAPERESSFAILICEIPEDSLLKPEDVPYRSEGSKEPKWQTSKITVRMTDLNPNWRRYKELYPSNFGGRIWPRGTLFSTSLTPIGVLKDWR